MSLGADIAAALPELRAQAESLMVDTCLITSGGEPVWDEDNGEWSAPEGVTVYVGKCRVRQPATGSRAEAGEAVFSVSDRIVSIPFDGPGVPVGARVKITSSANDSFLAGKTLTYVSPASEQTHSTARRLLCRGVD